MSDSCCKAAEGDVLMNDICSLCQHSMENNIHGFDQNDYYEDEHGEFKHTGSCTYCKECNPRFKELLK